MKALRVLIASLLLAVIGYIPATAGGADDEALNAQTQLESNERACAAYKKADAQMSTVYRRVLNETRNDTLFVQKMRAAQRAWLLFRDAHLEAMYPAADKRGAYGSVNPMCRCIELEKLTDDRTRVLKTWIEGVEEGDVCAGSIKIKPIKQPVNLRHSVKHPTSK